MRARHVQIRIAPVSIGVLGVKSMKTGAGRAVGLTGRSGVYGVAWKKRRRAGETKITNGRVTGGIPPARPRAGGRKRGFRARAARCGRPDAEGVSSTTRGRGRGRRTLRW